MEDSILIPLRKNNSEVYYFALSKAIDRINDTHFNPVNHGCVEAPNEWSLLSIHRFVRHELIQLDWELGGPTDLWE